MADGGFTLADRARLTKVLGEGGALYHPLILNELADALDERDRKISELESLLLRQATYSNIGVL